MLQLDATESGASRGSLKTESDLVRIGRAESNDLVLASPHVSGEHASIVFAEAGYILRDLNSTNGTRVRRAGDIIDVATEPEQECGLEQGDIILLGRDGEATEVRVQIGETESDSIVSVRSVTDVGDALEAAAADQDLFARLYEAQRDISAAAELDPVIDAVAKWVFAFVERSTHVSIALREDDGESSRKSARYVPIGSRVRDGKAGEPIPITRSVFKKVVRDREAVLAADAKKDVGETASMLAANIVSTIGIPLWQGESILGVLQVDNRARPGMFKSRDLDRVALLAQAASQAVARARLVSRLQLAEERQRTAAEYLKEREASRRTTDIIGESAAMHAVFDQLRKVMDTRVSVLITGETGTGKELIAAALHYWSQRRDKLFVAQNCAALPENLLESELFGHKKGAFTGATEDKKGLFEVADQGTLFLDEVGEMPLSLQAKLLRVLQEGEVRPVGASRSRKVDVRIVAATNRDLEVEVKEGRFREDLFYRLQVFPLRLPPLRERPEDIPLLAGHFLKRYVKEFGRSIEGFSQQAMECLAAYAWPGNVRELENEVQRLILRADEGEFVAEEHISERRGATKTARVPKPKKGTLKEMMGEVERALLRDALAAHDNNKTATAKTLGMTREGLYKKLKLHGMN